MRGQASLDFLLAVAALVAFLSLILITWAGVRSAFFANLDYKIAEAALSDVSTAAELACGMGGGNAQVVQVNADGNFSFEDSGLISLSYSKNKIYSSVRCPFAPGSIGVRHGEKLEIKNVRGQLSVSKSE
ncbi:MAG: hypothetical protein NT157_03915 [Candidatus Micrarchaeota archaeon]|nr:hypothetical protein [Candidatus Micrarchaeota archaeon]